MYRRNTAQAFSKIFHFRLDTGLIRFEPFQMLQSFEKLG